MSYTELYGFTKDGNVECIGRVKNSFRGAIAIWSHLEKKYLPKYIPNWSSAEDDYDYSRIHNISDRRAMQDIWDLIFKNEIPCIDRIVLGTTFDCIVVKKDKISKVIDAFIKFEGDTSLPEQAEILKAYSDNPDYTAFAWNQTSVCEFLLREYDEETDEYTACDLSKEGKYEFLFEEYELDEDKLTKQDK